MDESTHGGDLLHGNVGVRASIVVVISLTDAVDLAVYVGTMMIAELTRAGDVVCDLSWMPRSDTGNLSATTMRFTLEHLDSPALDDTLVSLTLGNSNGIDELVGLEDVSNGDLLLEFAVSPINFGVNISTVNLDLHNVSLFEAEFEELGLGVSEDADHTAVFLNAVEGLADVLLVLGLVFSEGLVL